MLITVNLFLTLSAKKQKQKKTHHIHECLVSFTVNKIKPLNSKVACFTCQSSTAINAHLLTISQTIAITPHTVSQPDVINAHTVFQPTVIVFNVEPPNSLLFTSTNPLSTYSFSIYCYQHPCAVSQPTVIDIHTYIQS